MKRLIALTLLLFLLSGCDVIRDALHRAKPTHVNVIPAHRVTATFTVSPVLPQPPTNAPRRTLPSPTATEVRLGDDCFRITEPADLVRCGLYTPASK